MKPCRLAALLLLSFASFHPGHALADDVAFSDFFAVSPQHLMRQEGLAISINSPLRSATVNSPYVLVKGTFADPGGKETGVTVNGKVAAVFGNEFAADHIALEKGRNTIEVAARDADGNAVTTSLTINSVDGPGFIRIEASQEWGISPMELTLFFESTLDCGEASVSYSGPGKVEFLSRRGSAYRARVTGEGMYYFTVRLNASGTILEDTVAVSVLSQREFRALLACKWKAMKQVLAEKNLDRAIAEFSSRTPEAYRNQFSALIALLPEISRELDGAQIRMVSAERDSATYEVLVRRDGIPLSFQLKFAKDDNGLWKIESF